MYIIELPKQKNKKINSGRMINKRAEQYVVKELVKIYKNKVAKIKYGIGKGPDIEICFGRETKAKKIISIEVKASKYKKDYQYLYDKKTNSSNKRGVYYKYKYLEMFGNVLRVKDFDNKGQLKADILAFIMFEGNRAKKTLYFTRKDVRNIAPNYFTIIPSFRIHNRIIKASGEGGYLPVINWGCVKDGIAVIHAFKNKNDRNKYNNVKICPLITKMHKVNIAFIENKKRLKEALKKSKRSNAIRGLGVFNKLVDARCPNEHNMQCKECVKTAWNDEMYNQTRKIKYSR